LSFPAILDFIASDNSGWLPIDGRLDSYIINDSEHSGHSSAALHAQPFRGARRNSATDSHHSSVSNQPNTICSGDMALIKKERDPSFQFRI
jgi:hypothetical protein